MEFWYSFNGLEKIVFNIWGIQVHTLFYMQPYNIEILHMINNISL